MLGFIFDIFVLLNALLSAFLRFGYIVLCILIGIGVVFGFCRKVCRYVWRRTNLYKKRQIKREEARRFAQHFDEGPHIRFADGRAQDSVLDRDR